MAFQEQDLPEIAKKDYQNLLATIATYATDETQEKELTIKTLEKIDIFSKEQDVHLAIKTYDAAYKTLGLATPHLFNKLAPAITDSFEAMLRRQSKGAFRTSDISSKRIDETDFLTNVILLTENSIDMELFQQKYTKTGLPNNPNAKLAYQIFLEDVDAHFDSIKQQIDASTATMPATDKQGLYEHIAKEKHNTIINHIKIAQTFQETDQPEKAITPFVIFSSLYGQKENEEELKESLSEYENFQADSTIWGAYNIADNIQAVMAKNSMFQIAVVPLKSEQSKDTPEENKETKTIPLPQAMEFYREKDDEDGVQAVLQSAVVPLMHSSGKQMVFQLKDIFNKIDSEPEYRRQVLSDIPTNLPMSLVDLTLEMTIPKVTGAGKIITTSEDTPMIGMDKESAEVYKQILEPIEKEIIENYVATLNNIESSEDMQACAEYLMANAIVTLENAMQKPSSYTLLHKDTDYYVTTAERGYSSTPMIEGLIAVELARPAVEKAINTFHALHNVFIAPSEDAAVKELNPLFQNVNEKLQERFKDILIKADKHLGVLLTPLENSLKKTQEIDTITKEAMAVSHIDENILDFIVDLVIKEIEQDEKLKNIAPSKERIESDFRKVLTLINEEVIKETGDYIKRLEQEGKIEEISKIRDPEYVMGIISNAGPKIIENQLPDIHPSIKEKFIDMMNSIGDISSLRESAEILQEYTKIPEVKKKTNGVNPKR